jgi:hypothetical protein
LDGLCMGAGAAHEFSFKRVYPPLVTQGRRRPLPWGPMRAVAAPDGVTEELEPTVASDDFADLLKLVPGCTAFPAEASRRSRREILFRRCFYTEQAAKPAGQL